MNTTLGETWEAKIGERPDAEVMAERKPKTPRTQTTDNGKQNTYFSSLDNMVAQGNVLPVLYGEMRVGSRVVSQEISTADEGDGGQVVVIGR